MTQGSMKYEHKESLKNRTACSVPIATLKFTVDTIYALKLKHADFQVLVQNIPKKSLVEVGVDGDPNLVSRHIF